MQLKQENNKFRCLCNKWLADIDIVGGSGFIRIKCNRCKKVNIFRVGVKQNEIIFKSE